METVNVACPSCKKLGFACILHDRRVDSFYRQQAEELVARNECLRAQLARVEAERDEARKALHPHAVCPCKLADALHAQVQAAEGLREALTDMLEPLETEGRKVSFNLARGALATYDTLRPKTPNVR